LERERLETVVNIPDPELYDTVFNVSFESPARIASNASRLTAVLHNQLDVRYGIAALGNDSSHALWQRESQELQSRIATLRGQVDRLNLEKSDLLNRHEASTIARRTSLENLDLQISQLVTRLGEVQPVGYQDQIARLDHEIAQLRLLIDNASTRVAHIPPAPAIDQHSVLYQRLDEIDNQIRRWRHVQTDIQNQRVRLRDEMLEWNELTLESDAHPYHNSRSILVAMESKVEQVERNADQWDDAAGAHLDTSQMADGLRTLCKNMRDELYGLCNELAQQYKHIRHKAAAAELKQLRRCYSEMGESINRLIERRESVIKEIAAIDPAGASAIVRADHKFCQCAQHEGHLAARRRFIGSTTKTAPIQPTYEVITPDLTRERSQLDSLQRQRSELLSVVQRSESEIHELNQQHASLVRQRETLLSSTEIQSDPRLRALETEILQLTSEIQRLQSQQTEFVPTPPNPLLRRSCDILNRISGGELTEVFLGESSVNEIQVRDRLGKVLNFSAVDAGLQSQVYLSLVLAAKEQLSLELPTLIDDAFRHLSADQARAALQFGIEMGAQGHQIILTTQHKYLAEGFTGATVLELSPALPVESYPQTFPTPQRSGSIPESPLPRTQPRQYVSPTPVVNQIVTPHSTWNATSVPTTSEYFAEQYQSQQPRPYPLTKYPRSNPEYGREDKSYTIAYPFAKSTPDSARFERELYGEPVQNAASSSTNQSRTHVSAVRVDQVAAPVQFGPSVSENTLLDKTGLFDIQQLRVFIDHRVELVSDLFAIDITQSNPFGFHPEQLGRWQSELWLLSNVPGMRSVDAQVLVACGVNEPVQLDTSNAQQLLERIQRFLANSEGRRFADSATSYSLDRVQGWLRAVKSSSKKLKFYLDLLQPPTVLTEYKAGCGRSIQREIVGPTDLSDGVETAKANGSLGRQATVPVSHVSHENSSKETAMIETGTTGRNERHVRLARLARQECTHFARIDPRQPTTTIVALADWLLLRNHAQRERLGQNPLPKVAVRNLSSISI
jgi:hypothetical protein